MSGVSRLDSRRHRGQPATVPTARRRAQLLLVPCFGLLGLLATQSHFGVAERGLVIAEALLVLIGGTAALMLILRAGFWAPGTLFFLVLGVFHLGLLPFWIFDLDPLLPRAADYVWFVGDIGVRALGIVLLAMVAYVTGAAVFVSLRGIRSGSPAEARWFQPDERARQYALAGAFLTVAGLVGWLAIGLEAGGWSIFFGSYSSWLALTGGSSYIANMYVLIGVGLGLVMIAPPRGFRRVAVVLFLLFTAIAFFLGLRGEVLFPVAVAASTLAFRRRMPGLIATGCAVACTLLLISAAKIVRQLGVIGTTFTWEDASPLSALAEMGSTLRVLATTVVWHEVNGEPFRGGDTYTVSIARLLEAVLDPTRRPESQADFRLMNSEVSARAGGIGGSAIAEAFHNFAVPGTVIVFVLFGVLMAYFSNMPLTAMRIAVYVVAAVPLFNHIRNSFVPVVPMFLLCLAMLLIIRVVGDVTTQRPKLR